MTIEFVLNGATHRVEPRHDERFLETLRERCGITSLKDGCSPQGQCGCCVALVDGLPKTTCAMPSRVADGKHVVTLDGLPSDERKQIADCFAATAGLQCGFCIPGIVLRAKALTDHDPAPTRNAIAIALDLHLCRCTGYVKIIDAVELLAAAKRGAPIPPPCTDGRVGQPLARIASAQTTLGDRPFVDDLTVPGMLHGALVLSPHPRARVLRIDTTHARALPGVHAVATAVDVRGERAPRCAKTRPCTATIPTPRRGGCSRATPCLPNASAARYPPFARRANTTSMRSERRPPPRPRGSGREWRKHDPRNNHR